MVRDAALEQLCVDWLKDALPVFETMDRFSPDITESLLNLLVGWQFYFDDLIDKYSSPPSPFRRTGRIGSLESTSRLARYVHESPILSQTLLTDELGKPVDENYQAAWLSDEYLARFALVYLRHKSPLDFQFDRTRFDIVYRAFEEFLFAPESIEITIQLILRNLGFGWTGSSLIDTPFTSLQVADGITLRRASEAENDHAKNHQVDWFGDLSIQALSDTFMRHVMIEVKRKVSSREWITDPQARLTALEPSIKAGDAVLNALRVMQRGRVMLGTVRIRASNPFLFLVEDTRPAPQVDHLVQELKAQSMLPDAESRRRDRFYSFPPEALHELPRLYGSLSSIANEPRIDLAFRRLGDAYARSNPADGLIDCWIALESLFAAGGGRAELGFRASLLAAIYTTSSPERRKQRFGSLRRSYDLRSQVVHGVVPVKQAKRDRLNQDINRAAFETLDTLRDVLRRCVEDQAPPDAEGLLDSLLG